MGYQLAILGAIWGGLTLYALLGGADFGGGIWSLLASGPSRDRQKAAISKAIAPVWEANHVWLIFVITGLFAAFPPAFEVLSVALYLPFSFALLGIVLRGSAFVFGPQVAAGSRWNRNLARVFGISSLLTPLFLGASAGAIAGGNIRVKDGQAVNADSSVWIGPFPALAAALALVICAYLAATYLTVESSEAGDKDLEEVFRTRALASGAVAGGLAFAGLFVIRSESPLLWEGMLSRGLPFAALSAAGGLISLYGATTRRYHLARISAGVAVAAVLAGWGASQWPYLILPDLAVADAAAPEGALQAITIAMVIGGALLIPSLFLLFKVFKAEKRPERPRLEPGTADEPSARP